MAKADGSAANADSWPGFLSELTKSFLILRDVFGYALPGAVFLAIGLLSGRISLCELQCLLIPYQDKIPWWLALIVGIGACYTIGHLMAQIAYFPLNTWGLPWSVEQYETPKAWQWIAPIARFLKSLWKFFVPQKKSAPSVDVGGKPDAPDLFNLREDHPVLLTEYDRQSVMTQLRGATGAAMVVGYLIFYVFPTPSIGVMAGCAGAFLLLVFWFSALPHMGELAKRTKEAGKTAMAADQKPQAGGSAELKQVIETSLATAQDALKKL